MGKYKFEIVESKGKIDKVIVGSQKITITFKDKLMIRN